MSLEAYEAPMMIDLVNHNTNTSCLFPCDNLTCEEQYQFSEGVGCFAGIL